MMDSKQAIEELVGEEFLEWFNQYIDHEVKNWPSLAEIGSSSPKPEKLKKFLLQLHFASQALFGAKDGDPGFLRFAISNLSESSDPSAESALEILETKRQEELARQSSTANSWEKLLASTGLTAEEMKRAEPKSAARAYISDLSDVYSTSEWQTAVGAFATYERIVPQEYEMILNMLRNGKLKENDLEVLKRNSSGANHILDKIVFDPETKELVFEGCRKQLIAHKEFIDSLAKYLQG